MRRTNAAAMDFTISEAFAFACGGKWRSTNRRPTASPTTSSIEFRRCFQRAGCSAVLESTRL